MNELIKLENGTALLNHETAIQIAEFEKQMKFLKEKEDELKTAVLGEMENKGIIKLETPELDITYVAPSDREVFDSKNFRKSHPDLYDEFCRMTSVKSSIRLKVK